MWQLFTQKHARISTGHVCVFPLRSVGRADQPLGVNLHGNPHEMTQSCTSNNICSILFNLIFVLVNGHIK